MCSKLQKCSIISQKMNKCLKNCSKNSGCSEIIQCSKIQKCKRNESEEEQNKISKIGPEMEQKY